MSQDGEDTFEEDDGDALSDLKHATGIQKHLMRSVDDFKLGALRSHYGQEGSGEDVRRLRDLTDIKNQEFSCWDRLITEVDRVGKAEDWIRAMRTMPGAQHLVVGSACGNCGQQRLDA